MWDTCQFSCIDMSLLIEFLIGNYYTLFYQDFCEYGSTQICCTIY